MAVIILAAAQSGTAAGNSFGWLVFSNSAVLNCKQLFTNLSNIHVASTVLLHVEL